MSHYSNKWDNQQNVLMIYIRLFSIRMAKVSDAIKMDNDQSRITGYKRILCISILIFGMFFNGIIYGLPSPSILSFQKDLQNKTPLDNLLPK